MFPEHSGLWTQCQAYNPVRKPSECPSCPIQGCYEFLCQGFKGVRANRLSFKLDFFLFLINLSDWPSLLKGGGTKEGAKGFRFKVAWNLCAQVLTGQKKRVGGVVYQKAIKTN